MREIDLERGQDVEDEDLWRNVVKSIDHKEFDVVFITPPCNTHSRARHAWRLHPGPRPLRDFNWPDGYPWLTGNQLKQCQLGNRMVEKTWEVCSKAFHSDTKFLVEHPEDLGRTKDSEWPASIWQSNEAEYALSWGFYF